MSISNSAKESLKNTGLVGGSQIITILIGIVKTKFVAVLLGPTGIGLIQLFESTISLVKSISGLGIGFSGVRDIAESVGSGDNDKIAKTIITLKRWSWVTGFFGVLLTIIFSKQLSQWTFGHEDYWIELSVLSIVIIFSNIAAGHSAIIRGARRMKDFVKIKILGALIGTITAIIVYYFFREEGIVPVLVLIGLIGLLINIFYSRKISFQKVKISYRESFYSGLGMVQLGIFTVITGFITQLTMYYVRISINDKLGTDSVGYYAVATTLAVAYMGLIFNAMSADYFPKLSAINKDNEALNAAILEQTKIVLLLGTPLLIGMYTFSEYIIRILYTEEFTLALPLLMWMLLSVFLRLIGFPIGYVFLAKGKRKIFIFTQSFWNIVFLLLLVVSWKYKGDLEGIGIAFTLAYLLGVLFNIFIIKKLTKFEYDTDTIRYILILSIIVITYFIISYVYTGWISLILKIFGLIFLTAFSFKKIEQLIGQNIFELIKSKFRKKIK